MAGELEKRNAAIAAMEFVEDGMTLGLGTGSTAKHFVELLADEVAGGLIVQGVPTSAQTQKLAEAHGIPLLPVDQVQQIQLTVDGADEADGRGQLIKGGGAALLREKIIANASDHMVVIADPSKHVDQLGAFALPVEVTPFGFTITARKVFDALTGSGVAKPNIVLRRREDDEPTVTDGGNYILDCQCGVIPDAPATAAALAAVPGVVEHGLFIGLARTVIIGSQDGASVFEY